MNNFVNRLALASVVFVATAAYAGIDIEVGNGDQIAGTLSPATEVETIRVRIPKDAKFIVKAKSAKKGPALHVALVDPAAGAAGSADGKAPTIAGVASTSGVYSVAVSSQNGTSTGDYSLVISWKSPTSFSASPELAPGAPSTLTFAADAGATATISAKPAKRSKASAFLDRLTKPDLSVATLASSSTSFTLTLGGDYVLAFRNTGATAGAVTATVKLKLPKAGKRKVVLTNAAIGSGNALGDAAVATLVNEKGGTITAPSLPSGEPGAEISGASVTVPSGALPSASVIFIATAPAITGLGAQTGAGPTVLFGPEGTRFDAVDKNARASVTIPYDPSFDASTATFVVYTRDAKGKVTVVPGPYVVDRTAYTVTFATSHFSSFRVAGDAPSVVPVLHSVAFLPNGFDLCAVPSQTGQLAGFRLLATDSDKIDGLTPHGATDQFDTPTFAGGGTLTADGTQRLQFKFPTFVGAVYATSNGVVYAATVKQVFRIAADGSVTRIAGTGATGDTGDSGPATAATFKGIDSVVATAQGDVFVCDGSSFRIRRIDSGGTIHAWAGDGTPGIGADAVAPGATQFAYPAHIALAHDGGLYVADAARLRKIDAAGSTIVTVAGSTSGVTGSTGDGGPLLQARFQFVAGVAAFFDVKTQKELIVVTDDDDSTVRLLDPTADVVTLLVGQHGQAGEPTSTTAPVTSLIDTPAAVALTAEGPYFIDDSGVLFWREH